MKICLVLYVCYYAFASNIDNGLLLWKFLLIHSELGEVRLTVYLNVRGVDNERLIIVDKNKNRGFETRLTWVFFLFRDLQQHNTPYIIIVDVARRIYCHYFLLVDSNFRKLSKMGGS